MSNQITFFFDIVKCIHSIVSCKFIVNELCGMEQVFAAIVGNYNVLNFKFNDLVFIFYWISVAVLVITHLKQFVNCNSNFFWNEMCQRQISWVMTNCTVLKCEYFIFSSQYSFFKRFRYFWFWNHTHNPFKLIHSSHFNIVWCFFKHGCKRDAFLRRFSHFSWSSAFRAKGTEWANSAFRICTFSSGYINFDISFFSSCRN